MKNPKKTIGIIGGMGPSATLNLYLNIIKLSDAKCDQENPHVIIDSYSQIPDRSSYISSSGANPKNYLIKSARMLEKAGADFVFMASNAAHYFERDIKNSINIDFVSILDVVSEKVRNKKTAVFCTDGTFSSEIYKDVIENIIYPNNEDRNFITDLIYNYVKKNISLIGNSEMSLRLNNIIQNCKDKGANHFVLACTELPIAFRELGIVGTEYIDSTFELAKTAVKKAYS